MTDIYNSLHVISENKPFFHGYDFPPLLAEPALQWWPQNKHSYYAQTVESESHCFLLPLFIVAVLYSFDFDQMRPWKVLQSHCSWPFFSKLSVLSNFYSNPLFLKAKQWQIPPTDLCPCVPHPNTIHTHRSCEKNTQGFEAEVMMSGKSVWWNNLTGDGQLHQQNTWDSEHILCPLTLCPLNAF